MTGPEAGASVRKCARELAERAADAGIGGAWTLLARTPREIELELRAHAARRRQAAEDADLSAWLTGRYALLGVHAPKRYPRRPDAVARRPRRMTDVEMKRAFAAIAARGEVMDGGC